MGALSRLPNRASVGLPTAGSTTTIAAQESGTWGTKAKPLAPVLADGFAYLNHCRLCPPAAARRRGLLTCEAVLFVAQNLAARRVYKVDLFAQETVHGNIQVFIVRCLFREIPSNTKTGIGTAKQNCSHHILNDENVSRFCQQSSLTLTCHPAASRSLGLSTGVTRWQRAKSISTFPQRYIDGTCCWNNDLSLNHSEEGGDHAFLSTCYVSCSHRSYDEPWLLDITSTSVAIIGLCSRTECPPRCEDLAEPPHYRPVHCRRSRLQVRVVL